MNNRFHQLGRHAKLDPFGNLRHDNPDNPGWGSFVGRNDKDNNPNYDDRPLGGKVFDHVVDRPVSDSSSLLNDNLHIDPPNNSGVNPGDMLNIGHPWSQTDENP